MRIVLQPLLHQQRQPRKSLPHAVAPLSATIGCIHDTAGHVIAETDAAGATGREYIWLGDLPVAVVDDVAAAPVMYAVHTDHLGRPIVMTKPDSSWAWSAVYKPFGEAQALYATNTTMDLRFPGQWFQLETGLAYNWHRHYDATTGRYMQADPLGVIGLKNDGPSIYAYARSNVFSRTDYSGLLSVPGGGGVGALGNYATDSACTPDNPMGLAPDRPPVDPARLPTLRECIVAILCWFGGEEIGRQPPPPPPPPIKIIIKP